MAIFGADNHVATAFMPAQLAIMFVVYFAMTTDQVKAWLENILPADAGTSTSKLIRSGLNAVYFFAVLYWGSQAVVADMRLSKHQAILSAVAFLIFNYPSIITSIAGLSTSLSDIVASDGVTLTQKGRLVIGACMAAFEYFAYPMWLQNTRDMY